MAASPNPTRTAEFSVVDIPAAKTSREIEALLETQHATGFRVLAIVPWNGEGGGVRVFSRRRIVQPRPGKPTNTDGKEDAALAIIRENLHLSNRNLVKLLERHGIERGKDWIRMRRAMMRPEASRP